MANSDSDVIDGTADITDILHGSQIVARVFECRPGSFWYVNQLTDEMPIGPFGCREDAEIHADLKIDLERRRAIDLLMVDT
jgi:hypothetical protein